MAQELPPSLDATRWRALGGAVNGALHPELLVVVGLSKSRAGKMMWRSLQEREKR